MASLPDWQPLEGAAPLPSAAGGGGRVVAVVATEGALAGGWAAPAALELARAWGREGERVVLMDGVLNRPALHSAAGMANREGITDAVFHGVSMGKVARPIGDEGCYLITAGSPVADAGAVARDPRWHRITAGVLEAGATLGLFLGDGESGTAAFLGSASDIVVLANREDPPPGSVRDLEPLVRAVVGPGSHPPGAPTVPSAATTAKVVAPRDGPGVGRVLVFLALAIVVAAFLGVLLTSGLG